MTRPAVLTAAIAVALAAAAVLLPASGSAARRAARPAGAAYTVVDLGTLGGTTSAATAVNARGWVVGYSSTPGDVASHAFLWRHGVMTDLGTLLGGASSRANAINDKGQIVGSSDALTRSANADGRVVAPQAFLYSHGRMIDIDPGTQLSYTPYSAAYGINDAGQVVGDVLAASGDSQAFLYSRGAFTTLPIDGGQPQAHAINRRGAIVGSTFFEASPPFLLAAGAQANLGSVPGEAEAINGRGTIAGWLLRPGGHRHAFLARGGRTVDLGTFGGLTSRANALDHNARVVGTADTAAGEAHAFLYGNGTMLDLNNLISGSSGWLLESATGISNRGEIVGVGAIGGVDHAFLLVPTDRRRS